MLTAEIEGVELDYCADELGVWFDEGEIEAVFASASPLLKVTRDGAKSKRRCPRCGVKMRLFYPAPDLELDICPHGDGLWFDAGEVKRLMAHVTSGGHGQTHLQEIVARMDRLIGGKQ
jgi:Zn-finger nucleic acid-binding protein